MIKLRISVPVVGLALFAVGCGDPVEDTTNTNATGSVTNTSPGPVGTVAPGATGTSVAPVGNTGATPANTGMGPTGNTTGPTGTTAPTGNTTGPSGTTSNPAATTGPSGNTSSPNPTTSAGETTTAPTTPVPVDPTTPVEPSAPEPTLITSAQNAYWQVGEVTDAAGAATVTVNEGQVQQDWIGFGGTFNERGWDALSKLSQADRDRAIALLFDKQDGAAFTWGRIPIGSSDYAMDSGELRDYTLNETPGDYEMANFSIERDRRLLIPYIKAALTVKPDIKLWASPWTPPTWMKSNGAFDRGSMKGDAQTLGAHALYLAKFVQEYAKEGMEIVAVHPQNEPGWEQDYPSCAWTGAVMADYIGNHLGPTFQELGLSAEIWLGTLSNATNDHNLGTAVMADQKAMSFIKGFGLQWGMESRVASYLGKGVPVMQTEHQCGNYPFAAPAISGQVPAFNGNTAPNDYAYGTETWRLIKGWIERGVNSYSAWNMVLDTAGKNTDTARVWPQNALLTVDTAGGRLNITPAYYVFRHFAQYVEPGAKRVSTNNAEAIAFKNPDGSVVTILFNGGGQAAQQTLSAAGKTVQFTVPAGGWATVNLQP